MFQKTQFATPASSLWFSFSISDAGDSSATLNVSYLRQYGHNMVPLELTTFAPATTDPLLSTPIVKKFERFEAPLTAFLEHSAKYSGTSRDFVTQLYLAQCPIAALHPEMQSDVPTPELVVKSGKGDVYDSNIWIGTAPTYTPLHKDPNPNLFVQLAGTKIVRVCPPAIGAEVFRDIRRQLGTNDSSATMRGEEMMFGEERALLEAMVWSDEGASATVSKVMLETTLNAGDGLFIPKGWWHSVKGVGHGMTGSVNWWFR